MIKHTHDAVDGDIYFVAHRPDGAKVVAVCRQGLSMSTGQPDLEWAYSEEELIKKVDGLDFTNWKEVPAQGEWVTKGMYSYEGKLIICLQDHTRTEHAIEDIPALFTQYKGAGSPLEEWAQPAGGHDAYNTGDEVMFEGTHYRSLIDANVWSPTGYPAGWEEVA